MFKAIMMVITAIVITTTMASASMAATVEIFPKGSSFEKEEFEYVAVHESGITMELSMVKITPNHIVIFPVENQEDAQLIRYSEVPASELASLILEVRCGHGRTYFASLYSIRAELNQLEKK